MPGRHGKTKMRFATVCSGIGAPEVAWAPLSWEPVFCSEIEPFPCAVLNIHRPEVPNLGDMKKFKEWPDATVELICAGTPCQAFSVAGLRKGLDDPRGNLTLVFLGIIRRYSPRWVVWENVPGVLSDKTGALKCFLDGLEELGYIIDIDIIDAQFCGVPQRRRRVFVCGEHVDFLLSKTTTSSVLTICQCLVEILHGILIGQLSPSEKERAKLEHQNLSEDGINRKMKLFGLFVEKNNFKKLQNQLIEAVPKYHQGLKNSDLGDGASEKERIADDLLTDLNMDRRYSLTEELLKASLEEGYEVMKSCITSTSISSITQNQIYCCLKAVLLIGRLIVRLRRSCPPSSSAGLSFLIALQDYTKYARQSDSDIFKQLSGVLSWGDFFGEADGYNEAFGCFGRDYSLAAVLFERHSLQGHTAPSRKTGQKVAGTIKVGSGTRGYPDPSDGNGGGMIACETSDTLSVGANQTTGFIGDVVAHSLRAEGFDASEDGTGRGTPLVMAHGQGNAEIVSDGSPSLTCNHEAPICFKGGQGSKSRSLGLAENISPTLPSSDSESNRAPVVALQSVNCPRQQKQNGIGISNADVMYSCTSRDLHGIQSGMQVRRLTPRECERLQGFPDDYTQVPYRGHASADGPRYKALGNSMAVPVVRWIGERIKATGTICAGIAAAGAAGEASTACNSGSLQ